MAYAWVRKKEAVQINHRLIVKMVQLDSIVVKDTTKGLVWLVVDSESEIEFKP